jgi:hypothetical protein
MPRSRATFGRPLALSLLTANQRIYRSAETPGEVAPGGAASSGPTPAAPIRSNSPRASALPTSHAEVQETG